MKTFRIAFALLLSIFSLQPSICSGYGNLQFKDAHTNIVNTLWDERQYNSTTFSNGIPWLLNTNGLASSTLSNVTPSQFQGIVSNAFATWQAPPETKIRFTYGGLTTNNPSGTYSNALPPNPALDGDNVVGLGSLPAGALAQTCIFTLNDQFTFTSTNNSFGGTDPDPDIPEGTYPAGTILDADILISSTANWSVSGERRKYDLLGTLVHEIGHFIGLSHSCVRETYRSTATLFPYAAQNPEGLEQCTLSQDDIAAISSYYPSVAFSNDFGAISGTVTMGGSPFMGAHVWAVKSNDRSIIVGTYTPANGTYTIAGLSPGDYILRVEPLAVNRFAINDIVSQGGIQIADFQAQCYGGGALESASPSIPVSAGVVTNGCNLALVSGSNADPFEPDNTFATAHTLMIGRRETHHFYPAGDTDVFRFTATNGIIYRISTQNITLQQRNCLGCVTRSYVWTSDTVMTLYQSDGRTISSRNDNLSRSGSRSESYILFTCKRTGDYYIEVKAPYATGSFNAGAGSNYDIMVEVIAPAQFYVSGTSGSDATGDGSQSAPWASVQHAVDSVQGSWDVPAFINVAQGTYFENIVCDNFESLLGGFDAATWERDPAVYITTLDGRATNSVLTMADAMSVEGFTIRNGRGYRGGGCYANGVSGNILNNVFTNNTCTYNTYAGGGAVCVLGLESPFISGNVFVGNTAPMGGALAYSDAKPWICYNQFLQNVATSAGGGGAISVYHPNYYISGSMIGNVFAGNRALWGGAVMIVDAAWDVLEKNQFAMNTATYGGAVNAWDSASMPTLSGNIFTSCVASNSGGAFQIEGSRPTFNGNLFVGNRSGSAGGAVGGGASSYAAYYYNNVFVGNESSSNGGAISMWSKAPFLFNNTFAENVARTNGGAVYVAYEGSSNGGYYRNNIFSRNGGGGVHEGTGGSGMNLENNDFFGNLPAAYYDNNTTNWYNTASAINSQVVNPGRTVRNNVDWNPCFMPAPGGTVSSISYNSNTYQSMLTDASAPFVAGALAGLTINPNTNQHLHFYIVTNTTTTITTWGDMTAVATSPCPYQVFDYHLAGTSQNINAGTNVSAYVTTDIDAEPRPIGSAFGIGADEFLDSDGDTLADYWEVRYGLNPYNADTDGDGMNDGQEIAANTNPTDPSSLFHITQITRNVDDSITIQWTSAMNRTYAVYRTTDLSWNSYTTLTNGLAATPPTNTYTDTAATNSQYFFYRVGVSELTSPPPEDSDGDGIPDSWMQLYFGHPTGLESDHSRAVDDPDGDGMSNLQEYLTGTNPTNTASAFRITALTKEGNNVRVTWLTAGGHTNVVQATAGDASGGYSINFTDLSPNIVIVGSGDTTTNYLDLGAATNQPARFYRVRIAP